ncbi:MAG: tRNA glutamyl-Q(34) synthetase GluQRS [Rhizobiaceae bacterium]
MVIHTPPVFRFAPSPNGALHLGHAYSALENKRLCDAIGGTYLLRIEDIDQTRCTPELELQMCEDLLWLGIEWAEPPRRQSDHFSTYADALDRLKNLGLVYPAFMTRGEIRSAVARLQQNGKPWPADPDGSPHYPGPERFWSEQERQAAIAAGPRFAWRLDMKKALNRIADSPTWYETGSGPRGESGTVKAKPEQWGDVVLARSDTPTSYHLSATVDDALQQITHVVRGRDLFHATSVHRVLQELLDLPPPVYHHHDLVLAEDGRKLSKSRSDTSLRSLRDRGIPASDIPNYFRFSQ